MLTSVESLSYRCAKSRNPSICVVTSLLASGVANSNEALWDQSAFMEGMIFLHAVGFVHELVK